MSAAPTAQVAPLPPIDPDGLARQVAMLCQGDEVYGIGTIQRLYARGLPGLLFICLREGPLLDSLRAAGARVQFVPGFTSFVAGSSAGTIARLPAAFREARGTAARLDPILRREGIRAVHTHWLPQQIVAGLLRRRGYRSVWQINNNTNRDRLRGLGPRLNRTLARWGADLILPASDFIGDNWRGCGVPIRTIRNAATPLHPLPSDPPAPPFRCVIAGRLEESKGHHLAVAAVLSARRAGLPVELDLFGGPLDSNPYADTLRAAVHDAGAGDAVRFLGFRTDLRDLHQRYHLGLQCRISPEPCSLWVCETLVDGLPLIAAANGGTPELVADGETGLLFRSGDADDLAAKLLSLLRDPVRLTGMRTRAYSRGQRFFTLDRMARETIEAYRTLLDAPARPGPAD